MAFEGTVAMAPASLSLTEGQIDRLRRRDDGAWTDLFDQTYPLVYRSALVRTRNIAVAEDIAAQVFLEASEGIRRYRDRGKPITAWLLTITRQRCIDWFRKRRHEATELTDTVEAPAGADLEDALDLLDALADQQREVVHLRFVEGYSLDETASFIGRSVAATKALQHRALARMRRSLTFKEAA